MYRRELAIVAILIFWGWQLRLNLSSQAFAQPLISRPIGIVAAMDKELDLLKAELRDPTVTIIAGNEYSAGSIGLHRVVMTKCGIGKVSAALGAQAMIDRYSPRAIINTGCAGSLRPEIKIGDIVLSQTVAEWDIDTTVFGDPRGYISSLKLVELRADSALRNTLRRHIPKSLKVHEGLIVSGDQFISTPQQRATITDNFPYAYCAEMEGAAIGHVCAQNMVPFCIIRCISDSADGQGKVDYNEFSQFASEQAATLLTKLLQQSW